MKHSQLRCYWRKKPAGIAPRWLQRRSPSARCLWSARALGVRLTQIRCQYHTAWSFFCTAFLHTYSPRTGPDKYVSTSRSWQILHGDHALRMFSQSASRNLNPWFCSVHVDTHVVMHARKEIFDSYSLHEIKIRRHWDDSDQTFLLEAFS